MVNDEELKRHIRQAEREQDADVAVRDRIDDLESTARCVHNELARRIENAERRSARASDLSDLRDQVVEIEDRLSELEAELA